jgi:Mg2+ and Co2+ transporter CorA
MPIKAYLFDAQGVDHPIELDECLAENIGENQLLWINASDSQEQELLQVGASLEIPDKVLGKAFEPTNRPYIETAGNLVQLTVIAPLLQGLHFKALTLQLIAGDNYVIAIHQGTIDFLNQFDEQTRGDTQLGELDSGTFLVALLNRFINSYFEVLDTLSGKVDRLDESALENKHGGNLLNEIVQLRHQVTELRTLLSPHRQVFTTLAGVDFEKMAFGDSNPDFGSILDRVEKALDAVENMRQMVIGSFEVFTSVMAQDTNDTVRLLTVVTVVIGLSGVVAGVMGMNFTDVEFFKTGLFGFITVVSSMILLGVAVLVLAKWRRLY